MNTATNGNLSALLFPTNAMVGSLAEFAHVMANGTEVPEEFFFAAGLTYMGALVGKDLTLDIGCDVDPRLYTILLGESYETRKSTAARKTALFFSDLKSPKKFATERYSRLEGCGSAEGLALALQDNPNTVLHYDELQAFVEKCGITGSALLQMVAALFEGDSWDNRLKNRAASVSIRGARLSLLGCCTIDTWKHMWGSKALDIGMVNRLFVMNADRKARVAWPKGPDSANMDSVKHRIEAQLAKLPKCLGIADAAKAAWQNWYVSLPERSPHTRRLDTIGLRLLALIALTTDKDSIDVECVQAVTSAMDYELRLRRVTDPIDAESQIARLEECIRRTLQSWGPLTTRELRQRTSADRKGIWAFERALENVVRVGDLGLTIDGRYQFIASLASGPT